VSLPELSPSHMEVSMMDYFFCVLSLMFAVSTASFAQEGDFIFFYDLKETLSFSTISMTKKRGSRPRSRGGQQELVRSW